MAQIDVRAEDESELGTDTGQIHVEERMNVVGSDDRLLGNIVYVLVNEDVEGEDLLVVNSKIDGRNVLLPAMAIEEAREGNLMVGITVDDVTDLPDYSEERDPTEDELRQAYGVIGVDVEFED